MEDRCVICGEVIPEGTEVCPRCYQKWLPRNDSDTEDPERSDLRSEKDKKRGDRPDDFHKLRIK